MKTQDLKNKIKEWMKDLEKMTGGQIYSPAHTFEEEAHELFSEVLKKL